MSSQIILSQLLKKGFISDELEFERVIMLLRRLRLTKNEKPEIEEQMKVLQYMIQNYEEKHWGEEDAISDQQLKESDTAEFIAQQEQLFIYKRKEIIGKKLREYGLNQQDLGLLLGHSKSYMSELMNGIHPFNYRDLIIIHRLFEINLSQLFLTIIPHQDRTRLKNSIAKLNKSSFNAQLKIKKKDLAFLL